jgi:hypothetical protein
MRAIFCFGRHFGTVHMFLGRLKKYQVLAKNLKGLACGFIEKYMFTMKIV